MPSRNDVTGRTLPRATMPNANSQGNYRGSGRCDNVDIRLRLTPAPHGAILGVLKRPGVGHPRPSDNPSSRAHPRYWPCLYAALTGPPLHDVNNAVSRINMATSFRALAPAIHDVDLFGLGVKLATGGTEYFDAAVIRCDVDDLIFGLLAASERG
ncbi:hypothetical protein N7541_008607 [Penicillium brevicompactum]|uniref:Uncharacterized protein n=1 Tax=Penicillium brevicompactum TaxID=5074 RepID=A0A9W9R0U6_PENBR|nr:hypothetical protein N7541_008607 [Penicillium brevicompactum]